ncbi:hypothetical protein VPHD285_0104 [Vibrio phage D285]
MSRLDSLCATEPVTPTSGTGQLIWYTQQHTNFGYNMKLGNLYVSLICYDYYRLSTPLTRTREALTCHT